jgi:hypothetical protein
MYHSGCGWGIEVKFLDFEFLKDGFSLDLFANG